MQIDYPFYSPEEMRILEERSESAYGDSEKVSGMIAAKQRKERHGVKHTVKLVDKHGTYTFTSDRNAHKFDSWDRRWKWGEIASYNKNERPLTEKFVECRGLAARLCTWLS